MFLILASSPSDHAVFFFRREASSLEGLLSTRVPLRGIGYLTVYHFSIGRLFSQFRALLLHIGGFSFHSTCGKILLFRSPSSLLVFQYLTIYAMIFLFVMIPVSSSFSNFDVSPSPTSRLHLLACLLTFLEFLSSSVRSHFANFLSFSVKLMASIAVFASRVLS